MKKDKIKNVQSWHDLVDFIESINPNTKTVVLVGWINQIYKDKTHIKELIFSTKDVTILKEKDGKKIKAKKIQDKR